MCNPSGEQETSGTSMGGVSDICFVVTWALKHISKRRTYDKGRLGGPIGLQKPI